MSTVEQNNEDEPVESDGIEVTATVAVYAAPDDMTAGIVRGMLEAEGLSAVLGEQVADAYGQALAVGEGYYAEIRVPADQADQERALIAAYENQRPETAAAIEEALEIEATSSSDPLV